MRWTVFFVLGVAGVLLGGCATGYGGTGIPDEEAIYDMPLEEIWPSVRQFFTDNRLPYREDPGSFVLETEWREEFGGSRVSGFWHRYMVLGKRETPSTSKLWIIRITRSANDTLANPGAQLSWGVSRSLGGGPGQNSENGGGTGGMDEENGPANNSIEDMAAFMNQPRGENAIVAGSRQGQRDLVMEWKVFHGISPQLAKAKEEQQLRESAPGRVSFQAPKLASAPGTRVGIECGMPIIGLTPKANRGTVMMLGELHGTQQVPRFVAQSACQVATTGTPVTVGLEMPVGNQERVAQFIHSAGTDDDWAKLMEAPFWRSPFPDGRGSEGMANLLEDLRLLRSQGLDVEAFVFDHPQEQGQEREVAMAKTVLSYVHKSPNRFFMMVTGNVHPRMVQGVPWDKSYRPMGLLISQEVEDTVSLDVAYNSGTAWICAMNPKSGQLECGVKETKGKDNGDRYFMYVWGKPNKNGFNGVFYVGPVTASLPAVRRGLGRPGADDNSIRSLMDAGGEQLSRR